MKPIMFILGLTLFTCFFVGNLYCQDSTKYVIELEKINVDHPILEKEYFQKYYQLDLNKLIDISDEKTRLIDQLFFSIRTYLKNDTCMNSNGKLELESSIDSLYFSFNLFLDYSHHIDHLSYGKGKEAGIRSLIYRINFQDEYISLLKYWFSTFYFVYIETSFYDCQKNNNK